MTENNATFEGFEYPEANFTRIPNAFLESMSIIDTVGEMKVVYYVLRHTWGYQDDCKKITLDEFQYGRKRKDGSRLDNGTGLAKSTIVDGLNRAEQHGFIEVDVDIRDMARIKKYYSLRMKPDTDESDVGKSDIGCMEIEHPSPEIIQRTEKETLERHLEESVDDTLSGVNVEEVYYRDKEKVTTPGRVYDPPWYAKCPACETEIKVSVLDRPIECQCALGAVKLLSKKRQPDILVPEALLIYQRLTGRKVPPAWQDEVVKVVGDNTDFWHDVVKAYVGMGWNSGNVSNMLKYFSRGELPTTRPKKQKDEQESSGISRFKPTEGMPEEDLRAWEEGE
jgi:hypothetical protein